VDSLPSLEEGMFGYSLTRPIHNQDWYYGVFDACSKFRCDIEGWHTESGPGVYEAALEYGEIREMADRAALFKLTVKNISSKFGITPCFMAKPRQGLPGNSGHMHVSLVDKSGKNLFARESPDPNPPYADVEHLSDLGRHFLAGLLEGLPDVMPIVAPTINSYKRLVENFWAPVTVSWGLEHRAASIRLIAPPTCPPKGTRFEVRVPGADTNGYLVLAAILALGWRGVEKKLELPIAPLARGQDVGGADDKGERLAKNLKEATARFVRKESIAREVFGDEFVEHFAGTREHEIRLWDEAVTDWYAFPSPSSHIRKPVANLYFSAGRSRGTSRQCKQFGSAVLGFTSVISWRTSVSEAETVAIATSIRKALEERSDAHRCVAEALSQCVLCFVARLLVDECVNIAGITFRCRTYHTLVLCEQTAESA
jgi:glutamine synthetase